MENVNKSAHILKKNQPSLFQNSSTGNNFEEENSVGERPEKVDGVEDDVDARTTKRSIVRWTG